MKLTSGGIVIISAERGIATDAALVARFSSLFYHIKFFLTKTN